MLLWVENVAKKTSYVKILICNIRTWNKWLYYLIEFLVSLPYKKICLKCLYYLHICNSKHFPCFAVFCYALVHFQSFVHSPLTDPSVIQMQTDAQKSNLHDMNRLPLAAELFAAAGRWCTHFAAQVCFFFAALSLLYCLYTCLHTHTHIHYPAKVHLRHKRREREATHIPIWCR